ncbi:hypothetical protein RvY_01979 [Ramazzottius varieornatus]|uniref:EF-hand domain-containing protein n=1 Tax=Ramazzottius varieornatus TaxID=947166 RepID=A0A1D1UTC5_RAMVA|nr:hypothetical protein RvY_01979 [Ramazzottius varieornatus]
MNTGRNGDAPPSYDAIFGSPPAASSEHASARGVHSNNGGQGGWTAWAQGQRGASSKSYHSQQSATSPPATSSGHSARGVNDSSWAQGQYGAPSHSYPDHVAHHPAAPAQPAQPHAYNPSAPQGPEEDSYDGPSVASPNWQEKEEEAELQMWFATVDEDNDGRITVQESQQALLNDNYTPFSVETIQMMLKMFDRNSNNTIEYAEFRELKKYIRKWRAVFDHFDKDHSGTINYTEISEAFVGMGYNLSTDFCKKLCARFGKKGSSSAQMNLDAFIYACASIRAMNKDYKRDSMRHWKTFEETLLKWLK